MLANAHRDMDGAKREVKEEKRLRRLGIVPVNEDPAMGDEGVKRSRKDEDGKDDEGWWAKLWKAAEGEAEGMQVDEVDVE